MSPATLTWNDAAKPPDADLTVLIWISYGDGTSDWAAGWWDGIEWLDAATGGSVVGVVAHWADPEGPPALLTEGRLDG
jgi:hypothetical protein